MDASILNTDEIPAVNSNMALKAEKLATVKECLAFILYALKSLFEDVKSD